MRRAELREDVDVREELVPKFIVELGERALEGVVKRDGPAHAPNLLDTPTPIR